MRILPGLLLLLIALPTRAQELLPSRNEPLCLREVEDLLGVTNLGGHYARYNALQGRYGSFVEYMYHHSRRRAHRGRNLLIAGGVVMGVTAGLFVPGIILYNTADPTIPASDETSSPDVDPGREVGEQLMIVSLYTFLGAVPLLTIGGVLAGRYGRRKRLLAPHLSASRNARVTFSGPAFAAASGQLALSVRFTF